MELRDITPGLGTARFAVQAGEAQFVEGGIGGTLATKSRTQVGELLGIAALGNPASAQGGQAAPQINLCRRVGIGAGAVIDEDRRVFLAAKGSWRIVLRNLAHRHPDIRTAAGDVNLARIR